MMSLRVGEWLVWAEMGVNADRVRNILDSARGARAASSVELEAAWPGRSFSNSPRSLPGGAEEGRPATSRRNDLEHGRGRFENSCFLPSARFIIEELGMRRSVEFPAEPGAPQGAMWRVAA